MTERTFFVNGIPALCKALTKMGREKEAKDLVKKFLTDSFSEDLDEKADRLLQLPTGIFPADIPYFKLFQELNQIYIAGLYYFSVVASGILCERICHDILDTNTISRSNRIMLFELIELLESNNLVKPETLEKMKEIRTIRNSYVHPREAKPNMKADAFDMIKKISIILKNEFQV